jgi:CubicO group peptidase (beta-lactamase class C family)
MRVNQLKTNLEMTTTGEGLSNSSQQVLSESSIRKLERYIVEIMTKTKVPGLGLALIKDDSVIYSRGFGSRSIEESKPATPDTLFGIGSVTKSFTALAVMQLVERGKLSVDDRVQKYIPSFRPGDDADKTEIFHLLTHTCGIPALGAAEVLIKRGIGQDDVGVPLGSLDDLVSHINEGAAERAAKPGERFFYWNEGYALLGRIIELVTGDEYCAYVTKNILKPLQMVRSSFLRDVLRSDKDAMTPYIPGKNGKLVPAPFPAHPLIDAAGGLISSANELANYISMCLNEGKFGDKQIIDPSLLKEVFHPHVRSGLPSSFGENKYGYGWLVTTNFLGHTLISHGGNIGVSTANIGFMPELGVGVTLASNSGLTPTSFIVLFALALLAGRDPDEALPFIKIEKRLDMIAGRYESFKGITKFNVRRQGFMLYAEFKDELGSQTFPLIPEGDGFYALLGPEKMPIEVKVDSDDKVDIFLERNRFHKVGKLNEHI